MQETRKYFDTVDFQLHSAAVYHFVKYIVRDNGWFTVSNNSTTKNAFYYDRDNPSNPNTPIPVLSTIIFWANRDDVLYLYGWDSATGTGETATVGYWGTHKPDVVGGVAIQTGDLEIGAVELKDNTTDDRVNVELDVAKQAVYVQSESINAVLDSGVASAGGAATLTQASKKFDVNAWVGHLIRIISGTGIQQTRVIASNTATIITVTNAWTTAPAAGDKYQIIKYDNAIYGELNAINGKMDTKLDYLIPTIAATQFNTAQPLAEAAILGAVITPSDTPEILRVSVAMSNAGIFRVARMNGGVTVVEDLNGGVALTAASLYIFDVVVHLGDTINFRYSVTGGTILSLRAVQIPMD